MTTSSCIICCEDFNIDRPRCVTPCSHDDICGICFLRIRTLNRDKSCPTCKTGLEHVICLEHKGADKNGGSNGGSRPLSWHDFEVWGETCGSKHTLDARSGIFFTPNFLRHQVDKLWGFKCKLPQCHTVKRDIKALRTHYQQEHQMLMCNLCIDNKQVFPSEQKVYTQAQYETHLRQGDGDGSEGHPRCEFCSTRFYDKTALFTHLHKDHYTCHLCEKYDGVSYKYYKDYRDLEYHFKRQHYFCDEPSCIEKKFVVFYSLDELNNHTAAWHPFNKLRRPRLDLNYDKKGGRGKGEETSSKFDAGVAGRATNGEWKVKVEERSVDPRAADRDEEPIGDLHQAIGLQCIPAVPTVSAEEEYPAFGDSNGSIFGKGNWQSNGNLKDPGGSALEDAFPALESAVGVPSTIGRGVAQTSHSARGTYGTPSTFAKANAEPTFGGIKIKEDKKAKKKQEAYAARMKLEVEERQKYHDAVEGGSNAMKLATGRVKANFALSSNAKAEKPRPSDAPSSVTLAKAKPVAKAKSLGSKGAAKRAVGSGGGWGMHAVLQPKSAVAKISASIALTSIGSKGPAMAPGIGGISRSSSTSSFGSGSEREGEKVAPSLTMGLGDFMGGGGRARSSVPTYEHYDEADEIANAVRAIDMISKNASDTRLGSESAPEVDLPPKPASVPSQTPSNVEDWMVSGTTIPPPPGLGATVLSPPPGLGARPVMATTMAKAVASGQAAKKEKSKGKGGASEAKKLQASKVSKKTKKELQSLLYS